MCVWNNRLCLLCRCIYSSIIPQKKKKRGEKMLLLILPVSSPSICLSPARSPGLDDTFTFHKSIFQTQHLPPPPTPVSLRSWIYKSEVLQVLNNHFCHFPSACLKAPCWTSVVNQTRVNNSHLNWQGQKSSEVAWDKKHKVNFFSFEF